jgi:hypothetical protein
MDTLRYSTRPKQADHDDATTEIIPPTRPLGKEQQRQEGCHDNDAVAATAGEENLKSDDDNDRQPLPPGGVTRDLRGTRRHDDAAKKAH